MKVQMRNEKLKGSTEYLFFEPCFFKTQYAVFYFYPKSGVMQKKRSAGF
jgi:hypothetical protein